MANRLCESAIVDCIYFILLSSALVQLRQHGVGIREFGSIIEMSKLWEGKCIFFKSHLIGVFFLLDFDLRNILWIAMVFLLLLCVSPKLKKNLQENACVKIYIVNEIVFSFGFLKTHEICIFVKLN